MHKIFLSFFIVLLFQILSISGQAFPPEGDSPRLTPQQSPVSTNNLPQSPQNEADLKAFKADVFRKTKLNPAQKERVENLLRHYCQPDQKSPDLSSQDISLDEFVMVGEAPTRTIADRTVDEAKLLKDPNFDRLTLKEQEALLQLAGWNLDSTLINPHIKSLHHFLQYYEINVARLQDYYTKNKSIQPAREAAQVWDCLERFKLLEAIDLGFLKFLDTQNPAAKEVFQDHFIKRGKRFCNYVCYPESQENCLLAQDELAQRGVTYSARNMERLRNKAKQSLSDVKSGSTWCVKRGAIMGAGYAFGGVPGLTLTAAGTMLGLCGPSADDRSLGESELYFVAGVVGSGLMLYDKIFGQKPVPERARDLRAS